MEVTKATPRTTRSLLCMSRQRGRGSLPGRRADRVPLAIADMPAILRQIVRNFVPGRLRGHENMGARPDRGGIDQGSHGDMDPLSVTHPGIKQRAASPTMRVVGGVVAENQPLVVAPDNAELVLRD